MGVVPPERGYLTALRRLCDGSGALLIFDEVITGFRVARGGAQELYGVTPDLTILGKIVGGGLPLAAFGGRADVMDRLAPAGDGYQAGTLSRNPLATAAGLSVLRRLRQPRGYARPEGASGPPPARVSQVGPGAAAHPGRLRAAGGVVGPPRGEALRVRPGAAGRRDAHALHVGRPGDAVRRRPGVRHRALRRALPRPARARRLRGAVAVRGVVR